MYSTLKIYNYIFSRSTYAIVFFISSEILYFFIQSRHKLISIVLYRKEGHC